MPEMPNVVMDETVESEWGNAIRDRTIQRYADATERSALHAAPAGGDLAYLENTGLVYVFHAGSWTMMTQIGMGGDGESGFAAATASFQSGATVAFTKPAAWAGYNIMAWGSVLFRSSIATGTLPFNPQLQARVVIDGVPGTVLDATLNADIVAFEQATVPVMHIRGPLTGHANVVVQFSIATGHANLTVQKQGSTISYMAIRTS